MTVAQGTPRTDSLFTEKELSWDKGLPSKTIIARLEDHARQLEAENAALSAQVVELQKLYNELLYGVARKHHDETRHQTALRYINNAETVHHGVAQANVPPSVKDSGT